MSTFARDYRQIALPMLDGPSYVAAARLAMDQAQFGEALAAVWTEACRLGALYLSRREIYVLREWLSSRLLRDCDAIQSALDAIEAEAWLDPIAHYDGLSDDPAVRWTFAAISPEYRRALVARHRRA